MELSLDPRLVFVTLEIVGIFAFALSGLFVAKQHRLDAVGSFIAIFLAAFGGGTLRDLMLEQRPFYWVEQSALLWGVLVMALLGSLTLRITSRLFSDRVILVADAVGLGIFSATGTQMALQHGWPALPAVLMGVLAATFGGLLRDIACNEKPMLMSDPTPYASVAFVGNWGLLLLLQLQWLDVFWSTVVASASIAGARLLLAFLGVKLPQLDSH
ncbi:MAG: TRIC cation channel family protein [Brachymonas denitrificans]|uniref:trimeric intracellular cation channel family protein n=1 Tax=Brachymonas denitrificans TaxID=28220 RepID=UPI001BCD9AD5|nr:TRIC cation channel family protein [Brachymonas denitrificans]